MNIPFTQTKEYLSWHEAVGEKTFYKEFFHFENEDVAEERLAQIDDEPQFEKIKKTDAVVAFIIIELKIGRVLYVPYGPYFSPLLYKERVGEVEKVKCEVVEYLSYLAKKENCVFVRLENIPEEKKLWLSGEINSAFTPSIQNFFSSCPALVQPPKKSFAKEGIFQPRVEWWLNLSDTEENIYNNFHKDHRYSIRRAQKENIEVEKINLDENLTLENKEKYFLEFWKLLKETSRRERFSLYDENYYKTIFSSLFPKGGMKKFLVFTKIKTPPSPPMKQEEEQYQYLSVALVVMNDRVANLVFAGSVSEGREKGFNHLMQWEAIKKAKEIGCEFYNFGGICENGYGKPGLLGVTNFKKRFGGFVKFHGDFMDMPIKKFKYFLYILKKMI